VSGGGGGGGGGGDNGPFRFPLVDVSGSVLHQCSVILSNSCTGISGPKYFDQFKFSL
jgi:hypothetical protein